MAAPNYKYFYNTGFHAVSTIKNQETSTNQPQLPNSDSPFPILAIVVLSIMGIAFLLIGYYFFVTKCCHNSWQRINLLRRISIFRRDQSDESFTAFSPAMWNNHGLDDSLIRDIPTFLFRKEGEKEEEENRCIFSCVVCLSEFKEEDMLRVLPNCSHAFHLDCIDIWLQGNSNCPLCRINILSTTRCSIIDQIIAPRSSPQGSQQYTDSLIGGDDEDFVVIELGGDGQQEIHNSSEVSSLQLRNRSPKNLEENPGNLKAKKRQHVSIMGDECIDVREKDEQFLIQPIRRSFSLDSAADRQLYLTVQAIVQQNGHSRQSDNNTEECSSTRLRRSLFSFGHGRGTKNAVLPINFEM